MKNMKKTLAALLAAAMLCTALVGCGGKKNDKKGMLIKEGVLNVGMEIGYPPFEDKAEDGSPVGYDVDLINAIGEKMGVEVNLIDTAFDVIFAGIDTNYDCVVSAVTITDERRQNCLFSNPYIENFQAVAVKKGSDLKVTSLKDLSGHSVILQKGTTSEDLLDDMIATGTVTDCTKSATEQILTCFTTLDNGEYEMVLCDSTVAQDYVTKFPDKYEIVYTDTEYPEQFGIAMGKNNTELQAAINKAMDELKAEGFFEKNAEKWLRNDATVSASDAA